MQKEQRNQNRLDHYRRRLRFTTSQIGHLLGHQDSSTFCAYERGDRLPSLVNAFCLGITLRVPVEFLFPELYNSLRNDIRAEEERMARPEQQPLF
jgi:DNA-binding XRE family transcriptional regulator